MLRGLLHSFRLRLSTNEERNPPDFLSWLLTVLQKQPIWRNCLKLGQMRVAFDCMRFYNARDAILPN